MVSRIASHPTPPLEVTRLGVLVHSCEGAYACVVVRLVRIRLLVRGVRRAALTVSHVQAALGPYPCAALCEAPRDLCRASLPARSRVTLPPLGVACEAVGRRPHAQHRVGARLRARRRTPVHVCPACAVLQQWQQQPQKRQRQQQGPRQQQQVGPAAAACPRRTPVRVCPACAVLQQWQQQPQKQQLQQQEQRQQQQVQPAAAALRW